MLEERTDSEEDLKPAVLAVGIQGDASAQHTDCRAAECDERKGGTYARQTNPANIAANFISQSDEPTFDAVKERSS
jgi:hypothetical protein